MTKLSSSHQDVSTSPRDLAALAQRFESVRAYTEALAAPLSGEDQVVQSMPDCSPTKWHRGHTTWFFEEFVVAGAHADHERFDPAFQFLFNSYYEAIGARQPRPRRGMITRPSIDEVAAYRRSIDKAVTALFDSERGVISPQLADVIELGTHHEQQHQELLLMDIKNAFHQNPLRPAYRETSDPAPADKPEPLTYAMHPGGLVEIGHEGDSFAFDNEGPRHRVWLQPFGIANRLVTAGDWLEFIADDGYRRAELWLSDGWATVNTLGWDSPLYWEQSGDEWLLFTLEGMQPVDPNAPVVHVSYYEADAFARWKGRRLPTEAEWEVAAAEELAGVTQLFGDVWQWTASSYSPYPGFLIADGAVGEYNGKFMVDQYVLRGSAAITSPDHARLTYRNFFPSSSRWAYSGLRLARDA